MRLRERDKREVVLREPVPHDDLYLWQGPGLAVRAAVYPLSGQLAAQQYGDKLSQMRLMLYDGPEAIRPALGVCVDVPGTQSCDYRVLSVERWDHQKATLEWIEEGKRGDDK